MNRQNIKNSKNEVKKILYDVGDKLNEKMISTVLYAPSEYLEDVDIPIEFFEEVFKKYEFDPEELELEDFIRDYYIAVKDFVIAVLYDIVFKEYLENYDESILLLEKNCNKKRINK